MNEETFESILYYEIPFEQVREDMQAIVKDYLNDCIKAHNGNECSMKFISKKVYL